MGIYDKNGTNVGTPSPVGTIERILQDMNTSNLSSDTSKGFVVDVQDDFTVENEWADLEKVAVILYDVIMAFAVIESVISLILILTIIDKVVRENSLAWYMFHICAMVSFVGLILHPIAHAGLVFIGHPFFCRLVIYGVEYIYFAISFGVILFNIELYFTKFLTLRWWEQNRLSRFIISSLTVWIFSCFLVAHIVIDNNTSSGIFCYILSNETMRRVRMVIRDLLPAVLCFISTLLSTATYFLKRSRISFRATSGELQEVRSEGNEDETEWLCCSIYVNITTAIHGITSVIMFYKGHVRSPAEYRVIIALAFFHTQSLYVLPGGLFFISDIRRAMKNCIVFLINKLSLGKFGKTYDNEDLAVSFGNVSAEN
ncbi:hypothetical protein ACF0H5_018892 [Mactra antiquata]